MKVVLLALELAKVAKVRGMVLVWAVLELGWRELLLLNPNLN
jgi:hypothetical protein